MEISIQKDHIVIMGQSLFPPFSLEDVKKVLGDGRIIVPVENHPIFLWDSLGIQGWLDEGGTRFVAFGIIIADHEKNLPEHIYNGTILIGKKDYRECKWKYHLYFLQEVKYGCFRITTLLPDQVANVDKDFQRAAEYNASRVEISYCPQEKKTEKYKLEQLNEPILTFTHFNFKLAVIQELMYEKKLLKPMFKINEFVKECNRKINVDKEGYSPIQEALDWFEALPVPAKLAKEITELHMDGGNDIYREIIPFWDGEDGFFNITELDEAEVRPFTNLKHITLLPGNSLEQAIQTLVNCGISAEIL